MTKTAFIVLISVFILSSANAVVTMCKRKITYTSPSSCSSYTGTSNVNSNGVSGCSGGSPTVTEFEVWGGCGPNSGSGGYSSPDVQTSAGIQPATNAAGQYCYCQIKSINQLAVAPSARWVFGNVYGSASNCANACAGNCAYAAQYNSGFRSALFSAVE